MENKPYWLKLLEHYSFVENRTGLTLPFIIGSTTFSSQIEEDSILSLLNEIRNNEYKKVMLKYCETIKEFILSVSPNLFYGSQSNMKEFGSLVVIQTNGLSGIDDFENIIAVLDLDYGKHINKNEFSVVNEIWGFYNPNEEKMIKEVFKAHLEISSD